MRRTSLLILCLTSCSTSDSLLHELQSAHHDLSLIEEHINRDDARIAQATEERILTLHQHQEIQGFVEERRHSLRKMKSSLHELRRLHRQIRANAYPTQEDENRMTQAFDAWRKESQVLQQEFDRLQVRDKEITHLIESAPQR